MAYLGENIKKLGFGLMRLPKLEGDVIDVEQTKKMVDLFMDAGFTYFDTAWAYAGSEDAIRQALVERYPREKFQLATKNAAWINCKTKEEAMAQFDTSLKQTGAGYFDFYLLHNLGEARTKYFDDFGLWDWVQEKKAQGLIKHVGFSFHSTPEELDAILNGTCKRWYACNSSEERRRDFESSRTGIFRRILGSSFCCKSGRSDHSSVRHEQCRADAGQSFLHERLQRPDRERAGNPEQSTGRTEENPADSVYNL